MTKGQFIYLVKTFFEGGDGGTGGGTKWHLGDIERYCEMAFSDTVEQLYRQAIQFHDWGHIDSLVERHTKVPVSLDTDANEYYAEFPVKVIQLPENGGVRMVGNGKSQNLPFIYMVNNAECVYDEIESFDGKGYDENTFYVEGTTIWIPKRPADKLQYINMKLIQTFDSYAETDEVPTVFGKDGIVFRMVLELMAGIRSADDNNDSSSKKIMQNV